MTANASQPAPTRQSILQGLIGILEDMTRDWDTADEGIGPQTRLIADLGFESIDVVHLVVAIEENFKRRDLPFEELLMSDGAYVDELSVSEIVDFLAVKLGAA